MSRIRTAAVAFAALLAIFIGRAVADGYFPNFPIVGGPSYCSSYSGTGTGSVTAPGGFTGAATCNVTVPAGPSALTGAETIIADTHLSGGQQPQTVALDISTLGAGPTQYSTPLTGTTVTIAAGTRQVIVNPAGTIAALTLTFPAASGLTEGQRLGFCTTQVVTALTTNAGSGTTLSNAPTAMLVPVATGAASCVEWIYVASAATWFRTQ